MVSKLGLKKCYNTCLKGMEMLRESTTQFMFPFFNLNMEKKSTERSYFHVGKKLHKRIMPQLKYSHVQGELSEVQLNYG